MPTKSPPTELTLKRKSITRSELSRLACCNSKLLPMVINDRGVRKEWVGIGWIVDGLPRGDEIIVVEEPSKLAGRFGIILPWSKQVILFGKRRLWAKRAEAEFHLRHQLGYADPESELHSAYVGEIGKDFWPDE
jgi:hypothetical protein